MSELNYMSLILAENTTDFVVMGKRKENIEINESETAQEVALIVEESFELNEFRWSVITFENCAVKGLTYNEAFDWREKLHKQGLAGLCIVTDEAADRITSKN